MSVMEDNKVYPTPKVSNEPNNMPQQTANRDAMSRALGAAFLSHKVEELEKTVSTSPNTGGMYYKSRRGSQGADGGGRGRGGPRQSRTSRPRNDEDLKARPAADKERVSDGEGICAGKKDADVVVVDASALVHSLGQLKAWCRNNREEVIVVPLEALNTLDLLKKGTSPLAQRARAASRILEQQVGSNPRIKVQRDDAFVLWDDIPFKKDGEDVNGEVRNGHNTPEWLRRTICCARWELDNFNNECGSKPAMTGDVVDTKPSFPNVTVAVCLEPAQVPDTAPASSSPVPLPAPQPSKHEQRCSGTLVTQWAKAASLSIMECKPTPLPSPAAPHMNGGNGRNTRNMRSSSEDERRGPPRVNMSRKQFHTVRSKASASHDYGDKEGPVYGPGRGGGAMVERPAATMAMNASMMQPAKIRVLARGEKLDP